MSPTRSYSTLVIINFHLDLQHSILFTFQANTSRRVFNEKLSKRFNRHLKNQFHYGSQIFAFSNKDFYCPFTENNTLNITTRAYYNDF